MADLYAVLDELGIEYTKYEHEAVHTCDAAVAAVPDKTSIQTKNLFLRDKPGRRHFLLVTSCATAVDIKQFAESIDAGRLSFGSPERPEKHLGVTPFDQSPCWGSSTIRRRRGSCMSMRISGPARNGIVVRWSTRRRW